MRPARLALFLDLVAVLSGPGVNRAGSPGPVAPPVPSVYRGAHAGH